MNEMQLLVPFACIALVVSGRVVGGKFRNATHAMVPFNEPLSYLVLAATVVPYIHLLMTGDPSWDFLLDYGFVSMLAAFWVGYLIGYATNAQDIIYVGVHQIVERTQEIEPIVRYTNRQGQQCWQPQGFKEICKTVFFGIHNPLSLTGNIYRTRHVSIRSPFLMLEADAVDLAGSVEEITEVHRWRFTFLVHGRRYTPSPNCTDSPYDWFTRAEEYEQVFNQYAELQVSNAELHTALQTAQVEGGAMVLNALASKNPSRIFMDQLGVSMEEIVNRKRRSKGMRRATREDRESEEVGSDV